MDETTVHGQLLNGLKSRGYWAFKIPDAAMGVVKPCDIVSCVRGVHVSIEAKINKVDKILPGSLVVTTSSFKGRLHQLEHGRKILADGGLGLVAACVYQQVSPYRKRLWLVRADMVSMDTSYDVGWMEKYGLELEWDSEAKGWVFAVNWRLTQGRNLAANPA